MAFNLKNIYEVFGHNKQYSNGDRIVVEKKMSKNVLGQINPIEYKKARKKRPGIHAKTKTSKLKSSKLYKKLYTGQG